MNERGYIYETVIGLPLAFLGILSELTDFES